MEDVLSLPTLTMSTEIMRFLFKLLKLSGRNMQGLTSWGMSPNQETCKVWAFPCGTCQVPPEPAAGTGPCRGALRGELCPSCSHGWARGKGHDHGPPSLGCSAGKRLCWR